MDTGDQSPEEQIAYNRKFKKSVMDVFFTVCDTFYVHCMPNPILRLGTRGLVDKEKEEGIILVFGPYSTRHLTWDENSVHCEMQFGKWEKVTIPFECIGRMFDKSGQVIMQWATLVSQEPEVDAKTIQKEEKKKISQNESKTGDSENAKDSGDSRVIQVDFTKRNKKD